MSLCLISTFLLCPLTLTSCQNTGHIIQPDDKNIVSIEVKEGSIPDEIFIGEFDQAGIKLVVTYSDHSTEEISVTTSLIPEQYHEYLNKPGTYKITLLYRGVTTVITVKMVYAHYLVNFYAYDDKAEYELISTQDIKKENDAIEPIIASNLYIDGYHYTFTGWDKEFTNVLSPIDVYAQYDSIEYYVVNFYNGNNELIDTQNVDKGSDAYDPWWYASMEGYTFLGWDRSYLNVTQNLDIYALYSSFTEIRNVSITNKNELQNEWRGDSEIEVLIDVEDMTYADAFNDGLSVTSSNESVVKVKATSEGVLLTPYGNGEVTITVKYKVVNIDSVELNINCYDPLRIAQSIDTARNDYYLRYSINGTPYFATDEMNGFYINPVPNFRKKEVTVKEDEDAIGDYKYTITIGEKMIGAYSGSHKNIGFVGNKVEDGGESHDLEKALFKWTTDHKLATNFFGKKDYYLAAYYGYYTYRIAFQEATNFAENAFVKLVEVGEPSTDYRVAISKSSLTMPTKFKEQLKATLCPEDAPLIPGSFMWSSSDESIATVDENGVVTALKESDKPAIITVTYGDYSATCTVTVYNGEHLYGTAENPLNVEEAHQFLDEYFPDGAYSDMHLFVKGVINRVNESADGGLNISLYDLTQQTAYYFRFQSVMCDESLGTPEVGDTVVAEGYGNISGNNYRLYLYNGEHPTLLSITKGNQE